MSKIDQKFYHGKKQIHWLCVRFVAPVHTLRLFNCSSSFQTLVLLVVKLLLVSCTQCLSTPKMVLNVSVKYDNKLFSFICSSIKASKHITDHFFKIYLLATFNCFTDVLPLLIFIMAIFFANAAGSVLVANRLKNLMGFKNA